MAYYYRTTFKVQVCLSAGGISQERLAMYRVMAAMPQYTADHVLANKYVLVLPQYTADHALANKYGLALPQAHCTLPTMFWLTSRY